MNTLARNFSHTFRRFFTASVLNIIGLAIAFASFFVIMTQVDYDLNFNKGYKNYEKIFRLEIKPNEEWGWQLWTPRPIAELIGTASPHVQAYAMTGWVNDNDYEVNGNLFNETTAFGFGDFMKVFQPEMIAGSTDALEKKDNVLIPASMAMRMFGSTDAVGKMLFQGGNHIFMPFDPDQDKNDWGNWNYTCYYRLDNPANVSEVEKLAFQQLLKVAPDDRREGLKQEKDNSNFFNLAPLSEVHFSKIGNKSASSRTTVYLLICVSFLIIIVAAINFMNFTLAETPMRIKSINTQKGATTDSLRTGLLAESVLISLIAFAASIVLLLILRDSGVQNLVTANLSLSKHLPLIAATFGISILIGVLAGLYPSFYVTS